jgi:hypothetical protein
MPKRKTFRKRHRKINQKGGAPSRHWLKITHKNNANLDDYAVEIIDASAHTALCASPEVKYDNFEQFALTPDPAKTLLLEFKKTNTAPFDEQFETSPGFAITETNVNWNTVKC